jgi:hypothetical protein
LGKKISYLLPHTARFYAHAESRFNITISLATICVLGNIGVRETPGP